MNRKRTGLLLGMLFLCCGQIVAQSPTPTSLVKAGRLLDPRTGNVLSPAAVLVENGRIKEVGPLHKCKPTYHPVRRPLI